MWRPSSRASSSDWEVGCRKGSTPAFPLAARFACPHRVAVLGQGKSCGSPTAHPSCRAPTAQPVRNLSFHTSLYTKPAFITLLPGFEQVNTPTHHLHPHSTLRLGLLQPGIIHRTEPLVRRHWRASPQPDNPGPSRSKTQLHGTARRTPKLPGKPTQSCRGNTLAMNNRQVLSLVQSAVMPRARNFAIAGQVVAPVMEAVEGKSEPKQVFQLGTSAGTSLT